MKIDLCVVDFIEKSVMCEREEKYKNDLRDNGAHWSFSHAFPVLQDVPAQQILPAVPAGGWLNEEVSSPGSVCTLPNPKFHSAQTGGSHCTTTVLLSG